MFPKQDRQRVSCPERPRYTAGFETHKGPRPDTTRGTVPMRFRSHLSD
jgi:hypothetical protein